MKWIFLLILSSVLSHAQIVVSASPFGTFGGGASYFFSERFDGTGYQQSWTESGTGTKDEDYATSPAPLEGSQSLRMVAAVQSPRSDSDAFSSDQGELWVFFKINIATLPNAARQVFTFRDSGAAIAGAINLNTTGTVAARCGANASGNTVTAMSLNTTYNVWFHYKKGTGANGIASVGFATGTTEPTSGSEYTQIVNSAGTANAHDIEIGFSSNTTGEFIIDQILVSNTATIGNNPQ